MTINEAQYHFNNIFFFLKFRLLNLICFCSSALMAGQQKLPSLWVWMLLIAALCPGAPYAYSKRAGSFRGRGTGNKAPPSQNRGLSKQGVKWAGAAAAGMLGGTGTGYGLGFLGKPKHGSGNNYGHKAVASEQDRQLYYQQRCCNQSLWRAFVKGAAPAPATHLFLRLGHVVPFLTAAWIRDV